jgi:hypothetical protein
LDLLRREVPASSLVVAIDPGKAFNRVWLTSGERGLIGEPVSLPVLREGIDELERLIASSGVGGSPVIGLEATGSLHRAWAAEIERRWPGSLRLFAPSETTAARAQLGSRRFKTDDRDCAALVWLVRQGAGRPAEPQLVEALLGTVRHRAQLVDARRVLQQRLHDQLNALCPGLSAPAGHGRALTLESPTGQAVLACAAAFAGRAPSKRSLLSRAPGRMSDAAAVFWTERWKRLLEPPLDAELRAQRLGGDLRRWQKLQQDIALAEEQLAVLLAKTPGQILTSLPGGLSDEVCVVGVTDLACVPGQDRREAVGVAAILARARPGKDPHHHAGDDRKAHWAAQPPPTGSRISPPYQQRRARTRRFTQIPRSHIAAITHAHPHP